MSKLSDTQAVILSAASQRDDGAILPLEDWLVLALIVGPPKGEGVLGPDDERRPLAAGSRECPL